MKVKVIELKATKLDPNALYLIVFNSVLLSPEEINFMAGRLNEYGVKFVGGTSADPERSLKIYQIPKDKE